MKFWSCDFCGEKVSNEEGIVIKDAEVVEALKAGFSPFQYLEEAKKKLTVPGWEEVACFLLQFTGTDWLLCENCYKRFQKWNQKRAESLQEGVGNVILVL